MKKYAKPEIAIIIEDAEFCTITMSKDDDINDNIPIDAKQDIMDWYDDETTNQSTRWGD